MPRGNYYNVEYKGYERTSDRVQGGPVFRVFLEAEGKPVTLRTRGWLEDQLEELTIGEAVTAVRDGRGSLIHIVPFDPNP